MGLFLLCCLTVRTTELFSPTKRLYPVIHFLQPNLWTRTKSKFTHSEHINHKLQYISRCMREKEKRRDSLGMFSTVMIYSSVVHLLSVSCTFYLPLKILQSHHSLLCWKSFHYLLVWHSPFTDNWTLDRRPGKGDDEDRVIFKMSGQASMIVVTLKVVVVVGWGGGGRWVACIRRLETGRRVTLLFFTRYGDSCPRGFKHRLSS